MEHESERRIVEVARAILAGTLGVIEGARSLSSLRPSVTEDDRDPDFVTFVRSTPRRIPFQSVRFARYGAPRFSSERIASSKSRRPYIGMQHLWRAGGSFVGLGARARPSNSRL